MNFNLSKPRNILRDQFFSLQSPNDIVDLLELTSYRFLEVVAFIHRGPKKYRIFEIPKKLGGKRIIYEPSPNLKIVQKKLAQVLEAVYEPKPSVHGFVTSRNIVTNATYHTRQRYVLNLDLKEFFPSIHFGRVQGMFKAHPYNLNNTIATILAQICATRSLLPQGAPTSPIISNMICARMDSQLQALAKESHCFYTRYADDITFSTSRRHFPKSLAVIIENQEDQTINIGHDLESIIAKNGFKINEEKIRLQTRNRRQEVTGLTVNKFANVNRKFIRQIRAMLYAWEKFGYADAEAEHQSKYSTKEPNMPYKKAYPSFRKVIKGKIEFVSMVRGKSDPLFIKLNNHAAKLERDSSFKNHIFKFLENSNLEILSIIQTGETEKVEFKAGACLNPHTSKPDKKTMSQEIIEEVAGFLNSSIEGTVIIGVKDNGDIIGIEREFATANPQKKSWDGYELFLTSKLNDSFSNPPLSKNYRILCYQVQGKLVCAIKTTPAKTCVFAKNKFYIRVGTQTKELKGYEMLAYIKDHW